jgi:hypothetical protein
MQPSDLDPLRRVAQLGKLQRAYPRSPVHDSALESPAKALQSLVDARKAAPPTYADYLNEAVTAYEEELYRAAILMVWAATVEHLYGVVEQRKGGVREFETANVSRYGGSRAYRELKKVDDLRYLKESQFIQLGEDSGMFNRNARSLLTDRLDLRNRCGHPTGYKPGREETVIFIESLTLNFLTGSWLNW